MRSKIFILLYFISAMVFAQQNDASNQREARALLRDGNELYQQKKYADAEVAFIKALEKNSNYNKAIYNLGNTLYQQNRNEEAAKLFEAIAISTKDKSVKAEAFHNLGNSFMKAKKYSSAVESYKNALRNNSFDEETRYNLALAQKLLKEQEQNKDNQDKKDDQDNQDNQDKKDDQDNQDKKDQNQDKKEQDKKENQQKQQPQPNKLSQQQIEQLLDAMNKVENKTQQKVNAQKVLNQPNKKEKDW